MSSFILLERWKIELCLIQTSGLIGMQEPKKIMFEPKEQVLLVKEPP